MDVDNTPRIVREFNEQILLNIFNNNKPLLPADKYTKSINWPLKYRKLIDRPPISLFIYFITQSI